MKKPSENSPGKSPGKKDRRPPSGSTLPASTAPAAPARTPAAPVSSPAATSAPTVTLRTIRKMVDENVPFACLTCYDATTARWLERAGIPILLVGDTAAEVILGFKRTLDMPLDVLIALTAAVKRGAPRALVMGDMPFLSYHTSEADAIRNAGRFVVEGMADIVKVEATSAEAPRLAAMARAGIPLCGHVGCRPQQVAVAGGYVAAGRTVRELEKVVDDAVALEQAGCVMLLVEAVPDEVARAIMERTSVPLIGIGAGSACHGQVLVLQDLLGFSDMPPRFAEAVASLGVEVEKAGREWVRRVAERRIGGRGYSMQAGEAERLRNQNRSADGLIEEIVHPERRERGPRS
ncbi:MAG: 3-methyl-2-oxobutanoate hydroxymethyltransferase [Phycisphaerales bacterium]|nr:3-methyl-2-oxobutanoate hydroxymethyltransferase [Phycisphaerales bacterium]